VFHTRPSRDAFLSGFSGPVIVVSGADDIAPGPKASAEQAALTRNGEFHLIPDCGHYVPLEKPEALNAILRELFNSFGRS
jgi:pimeloyl-[acyl-carrier protein] methyl ester esterase